jgi:polyhydroxyalkanoate synthesis repressor PhaR
MEILETYCIQHRERDASFVVAHQFVHTSGTGYALELKGMNRPNAPRVIKKYSNRRLYDTSESRYVTLDELAESIRRGAEIRVLDAQNGTDLTQATLAQIILEGRGAVQFLSVAMLTQLVRMNDDALADFFSRWVSAALELYQQARQGAQALAPFNPLATMPFAAGEVIARMLGALPGPWSSSTQHSAPQPTVVTARSSANVSETDSIDALRRELDEIKRSLRKNTVVTPERERTRSGTEGSTKKRLNRAKTR